MTNISTTYLIGDLGFVYVYPTPQNHNQVFESSLGS